MMNSIFGWGLDFVNAKNDLENNLLMDGETLTLKHFRENGGKLSENKDDHSNNTEDDNQSHTNNNNNDDNDHSNNTTTNSKEF